MSEAASPQSDKRTLALNLPHAACRNCHYDLSTLPSALYCPNCGQETDPSPPTLSEFVNHFFGNYIAVRGGFMQTLWRLISKPGALTLDYLQGRKRRYMLPFRLYLTISVISFLVFGLLASQGVHDGMVKAELDLSTNEKQSAAEGKETASGAPPAVLGAPESREATKKATSDNQKTAADTASKDVKSIEDIGPSKWKKGRFLAFGDDTYIEFDHGKITCKNMPAWLCARAKSKFGSNESFKSLIESLPERIIRYWAYAMFALVPLFAGLLKLVYVRRRLTYGSHVVFALHLHAFWLLAILVAFAHDWLLVAASVAVPLYALLAMRRVYGGGWIKTIAKAALVSLVYVIIASIGVGLVAIVALIL